MTGSSSSAGSAWRAAPWIAAWLLLIAPAVGQLAPLAAHEGQAVMDRMGSALSGGVDLDGDGLSDLLAGVPRSDAGGRDAGRVLAFAGADGRLLYQLVGLAAGDRFGSAIAPAGDLDGDGIDDFVVGSPGHDANGINSGRISWHSGLTGQVLHTIDGDQPLMRIGSVLCDAGDMDGDSKRDLVAGAPEATRTRSAQGIVRTYSGATGALIHERSGDSPVDSLGWAVAGGADLDGDGVPDFAASAPQHHRVYFEGYVRAWSGATGALIETWRGSRVGEAYGWSLALDTGRIAIGTPRDSTRAFHGGRVVVLSAPHWTERVVAEGRTPSEAMGTSLHWQGDVNGDGRPDLLIGGQANASPQSGAAGKIALHSGVDLGIMATVVGDSLGDGFGAAVAVTGDMNRDGFHEVLVGAPDADGMAGESIGRITAHALCGAHAYGTGGGLALTFLPGLAPSVHAGTVRVDGAQANAAGFVFCSFAPADLWSGGIHVLVDPNQGPMTWGMLPVQFDAAGEVRVAADLRSFNLAGVSIFSQALDVSTVPARWSNGLELILCR